MKTLLLSLIMLASSFGMAAMEEAQEIQAQQIHDRSLPTYFHQIYKENSQAPWSESTSLNMVNGFHQGQQNSGEFTRFQNRVISQLGEWYVDQGTGLIVWIKGLEETFTWGTKKKASKLPVAQASENPANSPVTKTLQTVPSQDFRWEVAVVPLNGKVVASTQGFIETKAELQILTRRVKIEISKKFSDKYHVAINSTAGNGETRSMLETGFSF